MEFNQRFVRFYTFILAIWITSMAIVPVVSLVPNSCLGILDAVRWMLHPIDITNFNAHSEPIYNGNPVLSVSCDSNATWSTVHLPNRTFQMPDQIAQFIPNEWSNLESPQVSFAHDMIDLQNIFLSMSTQPDNLIGACSRNSDYNYHLDLHFRSNTTFALMSLQTSVYSIELKPPHELILDPNFANYISNLPVMYELNVTAYKGIIDLYGTHYLERATFGGMIVWNFSIPNEYFHKTSEEEIEANMKTAFFDWIGQSNGRKTKSYEEFCTNVKNSDLLRYTSFGRFSKKSGNFENLIYLLPGLTEQFLKPLENLIADVNVRAQMKLAIEMYRIEAYLGELMAAYEAAKLYYRRSEEDRVLLEKVETFLYSNISTTRIRNEAFQIIDDLYSKVKDKPKVDQLITDYYMTATLKSQFARSICDAIGSCPTSKILTEQRQFEQLYHEYESSKAEVNMYYTREMFHKFGQNARLLNTRYRIQGDLQGGLGASCEKC